MRKGRTLGAPLVLVLAALLSAAVPAPESPVADAAQSGDMARVRELLSQGADVNGAQGDGMTALHWAAERGDGELTTVLIAAGADPRACTRIGCYTPLHLASKGGRVAVARELLAAGADVKARVTSTEATALHMAAAAVGGEAVVALLLDHGADVDAREGSAGQTPLMFAASANRTASLGELLRRGADPGQTTEVIEVLGQIAADREADRVLSETLAAMREREGGGEDWRPTATEIQEAIQAQRSLLLSPGIQVADLSDLATTREVLQQGAQERRRDLPIREILVSKTGGMTALLHAAREGYVESALALLEGGADLNQVSPGDATSPLLMATLNGHYDLALQLLEHGADPTLASSTDGATPLFAAIQTRWAPKTQYPQPRAQDLQKADLLDVVEALLEAGADPDVQLETHLWYWEYGYNRIGIDIGGATPFWRAAIAQDLDAMRLLVGYGADPGIPTILPEVGMRENRQQDGRLQEDSGLPPTPAGAPNAYPIHAAAGGGYLGLGAHSVRNVPDGFLPAVRYLVEEHRADVNERDWWGYTPLHYAASRGANELIRYLVERGADVTALTRLGQSAADMTRGGRGGYFQRVALPETLELLESLGSPLVCLNVHFMGTGDVCEAAGAQDSPARGTTGGGPAGAGVPH